MDNADRMDSERYTIEGATGVDLTLSVAGPGSRSYAFLIDWHIRVLLALAWLIVALIIVKGAASWRAFAARPGAAGAFLILLPALVIYFLYHPVVELFMRGQTPGKRMAGVRIVDRHGGIPGVGAILIRNIFRLVDSLPAFYVVGLASTFVSAQRVRIGDLAAGTVLVVDERAASGNFLEVAGDGRANADLAAMDLAAMDLAAQILERWPELSADRRGSIARTLLERILGMPEAARICALGDAALKDALARLARGSAAT